MIRVAGAEAVCFGFVGVSLISQNNNVSKK